MEAFKAAVSEMPKAFVPFLLIKANKLMSWESFHNLPLENAIRILMHFGYSPQAAMNEWADS